MTRIEILTHLIEYDLPMMKLKDLMKDVPWDCQNPLVVFKIQHVQFALHKYLDKKCSAKDLEEWADLIEVREDIECSADILKEFLFQTSTPEINFKITEDYAEKWLKRLVVPSVRAAFDKLQSMYRHLKTEFNKDEKTNDIEFVFKKQKGLDFEIVSLLEDPDGLAELRVWVEGYSNWWLLSPESGVGEANAIDRYMNLMTKLIEGKIQINFYLNKKGKMIKAEAIDLTNEKDSLVSSYRHGLFNIFNFGIKEKKVLRNIVQ